MPPKVKTDAPLSLGAHWSVLIVISRCSVYDLNEQVHAGSARAARCKTCADLTYWEAQAWIGGDINKLWFKTEGSRIQGTTEDANLELYYSRAVAAFRDAQIGVRHDLSAGNTPAWDWLGIGFQGLAPYLFEVDATAYLGGNGRSALRFKAGYDLLLSQRLVFMPELELSAYGKVDPERSLGSGLADASVTMRIRYEIRREFAPYIGVMWTQKYGGTADYARAAGDAASETQYLPGGSPVRNYGGVMPPQSIITLYCPV